MNFTVLGETFVKVMLRSSNVKVAAFEFLSCSVFSGCSSLLPFWVTNCARPHSTRYVAQTRFGWTIHPGEFPNSVLNGNPLDLFNLYRSVVDRGGFKMGNAINWKGEVCGTSGSFRMLPCPWFECACSHGTCCYRASLHCECIVDACYSFMASCSISPFWLHHKNVGASGCVCWGVAL